MASRAAVSAENASVFKIGLRYEVKCTDIVLILEIPKVAAGHIGGYGNSGYNGGGYGKSYQLSQPNNNHKPNNETIKNIVGLRLLSNCWETTHHHHTNSKLHDRA